MIASKIMAIITSINPAMNLNFNSADRPSPSSWLIPLAIARIEGRRNATEQRLVFRKRIFDPGKTLQILRPHQRISCLQR